MRRLLRISASAVLAIAMLAGAGNRAIADETGAIGQIVPGSGVVNVIGNAGAMVRAVHVRVGQRVKAGQVLMTVEDDSLAADLDLARQQLDAAKKLASQQEAAQDLAVELARKQLARAQQSLAVYRTLGATSTSKKELARQTGEVDDARLQLQIELAKQQMVNTQSAGSILTAQRQLAIASAATELTAPFDGTVLQIARNVGERLGAGPVIELGDLRTMYVVCQVYEGDIIKLRPGMKATVKNPVFSAPLTGTVEQIGRMIDSREKLGEVRIRLDRPDPADRLVGMQVEVNIAR